MVMHSHKTGEHPVGVGVVDVLFGREREKGAVLCCRAVEAYTVATVGWHTIGW
jgi:hypothetical protein